MQRAAGGAGALTGLQTLNLGWCFMLRELPAGLRGADGAADAESERVRHAEGAAGVARGADGAADALDLSRCSGLRELPAGLGELTGLQTLDLESCSGLRLPAWLGG